MSNKKPNLRKNVVAMVTIALVLSKFARPMGRRRIIPQENKGRDFKQSGATPLTTGRIGAVQPVMVEAMQLIYP